MDKSLTFKLKDDRKIGFELEFASLSLNQVATLIQKHFAGQTEKESEYVLHIRDSQFGDFRLEIDSSFLKNKVYVDWLASLGIKLSEKEQKRWDILLANHTDIIVPKELVSPPIRRSECASFYLMVEELKTMASDQSRFDFSLAPLGLHLNFEVASLNVDYLLATLQSFCLNYKKLINEVDVDFNRSLAPYIAPFPEKFVDFICRTDYRPNISEFISDYLDF